MEKNKLHRGLLCGNCVPLSFKKKKMKKKKQKYGIVTKHERAELANHTFVQ